MQASEQVGDWRADPYALEYPETAPFWEAAQAGTLLLPHCAQCGRCHWHPRAFCPLCGAPAPRWTRASGQAAVCLASSGPGATNLITAIADARLDSIPVVCITGQVPSAMIGTDAFQEVDTYGLTVPITKHNFLVDTVEELLDVLPRAFRIALSGRRDGPTIEISVQKPNRMSMPYFVFCFR